MYYGIVIQFLYRIISSNFILFAELKNKFSVRNNNKLPLFFIFLVHVCVLNMVSLYDTICIDEYVFVIKQEVFTSKIELEP